MTGLNITAGPFKFQARFETGLAPKTCEIFQRLLPYQQRVIHVRWSGEAVGFRWARPTWACRRKTRPATRRPARCSSIPAASAKPKSCSAYGGVCFASKMGQLAGNHFITITSPLDDLPKLGKMVLWEGAQAIRIEEA